MTQIHSNLERPLGQALERRLAQRNNKLLHCLIPANMYEMERDNIDEYDDWDGLSGCVGESCTILEDDGTLVEVPVGELEEVAEWQG